MEHQPSIAFPFAGVAPALVGKSGKAHASSLVKLIEKSEQTIINCFSRIWYGQKRASNPPSLQEHLRHLTVP
eukprot:11567125-Heterocapsa_arctica.AAC.1